MSYYIVFSNHSQSINMTEQENGRVTKSSIKKDQFHIYKNTSKIDIIFNSMKRSFNSVTQRANNLHYMEQRGGGS